MIQANEALALLEKKFQGVRKDGLSQIARTFAMMCNTTEEAENLINNLTEEAINSEIKAIRSSIDSEVSKATATHEAKLKEKYSFVEKDKEEKPQPKADPDPKNNQQQNPTGMLTKEDISALILEAQKPLLEKLASYEQKGINDARREKLSGVLSDVPEFVKNAVIGQFEAKQFASEDEFNEYLTSQTNEVNAYRTQLQGARMGAFRPRVQNDPSTQVDPSVEAYLKERQANNTQQEGRKLS